MADTAKYTPERWATFEHADHSGLEVGPPYPSGMNMDGWVHDVCRLSGNGRKVTDEQRAHARFIAAAPEMAEMLRGKVLAALRQPQAMDIEGVCEDVEELLKKAGVL